MHVLERVPLLVTDAHAPVRHALLLLLRHMVPLIQPAALLPFTPLLLAHTCMAMTKLDHSIRQNALDFLDLWIEHVPSQVVAHAPRLLQNLLQLISQERTTEGGEGTRSLIVNPHSKLVQQTARIAVMRRFHAILTIVGQGSAPSHQAHQAPCYTWGGQKDLALVMYPSPRYGSSYSMLGLRLQLIDSYTYMIQWSFHQHRWPSLRHWTWKILNRGPLN